MNIDQKLTAIRDLIQQDVGNRGLSRDPGDNLLTMTHDDFANSCRSVADDPNASVLVLTGFFIPFVQQYGAFETDGPLGTVFLTRAFSVMEIPICLCGNTACIHAMHTGAVAAGVQMPWLDQLSYFDLHGSLVALNCGGEWVNDQFAASHYLAIEHPGRAADGKCYTMRAYDISGHSKAGWWFDRADRDYVTIGIGDGGNEIGMGKIPHETIVKNIPNGDLIHCRVPTDYLIVAGVSNWGAYALAAGVALLRGVELPAELFDPDREREILQVMVDAGPLVDGVTGKQEATVDGLSWDDYIKPLVEIGKIVRG